MAKQTTSTSARLANFGRGEIRRPMVADACGQFVDPETAYVWTETSVKATFVAALSSRYIEGELIEYKWLGPTPALHALIKDASDGHIGIYRLNPDNARPYEVLGVVVRGRSLLVE